LKAASNVPNDRGKREQIQHLRQDCLNQKKTLSDSIKNENGRRSLIDTKQENSIQLILATLYIY
jgi:hypothetical protein